MIVVIIATGVKPRDYVETVPGTTTIHSEVTMDSVWMQVRKKENLASKWYQEKELAKRRFEQSKNKSK